MPAIDIVIPHVDGSVPGYEELSRKFTGEFVPCQLRDLGELRFVLRSIEKYLGWANVVLVVQSEGHVPTWLDRQVVRVVRHEEFIPEELLPTFHWATIAAHIHRIPGLSENYVYWEDDVVAGTELGPDDLFSPDGMIGLEWAAVPICFKLGSLLGTYQLNLEETRRVLGRMLRRPVHAFIYPHAPLPSTRQSWREFYAAAMEDPSFRSTVTRRSRGDERANPTVDPTVLYANWVEAKARGKSSGVRHLHAIAILLARLLPAAVRGSRKELRAGAYPVVNDMTRMRRNMDALLQAAQRAEGRTTAAFHNVNDAAYDSWNYNGQEGGPTTLNPAAAIMLEETLKSLLGRPSRFEQPLMAKA